MRSSLQLAVLSCGWLLGALLLSLAQRQVQAANNFPAYPIDWTATAADASGSDTNSTDLSSSCICALLNSATCTPDCCCDPSCPASVVDSWRAAGSCQPEGPPPEQLAYCTPDEPFAKVNLHSGDFYRIQKAPAGADFWTQLLCITADHNPSLGSSYPDPPAGDVGSNAQFAACPAAGNTPAAATAAAASSSYSYGQAVVVSAPAGAARVSGRFSLPAGVLSAECLDVAQVGFMARHPASLKAQSSFCQRTISTAAALTALCNDPDSPLSPTYYSGLRFPATPVSATSKAINLTALSRRDPATGALTALDPATAWVAPSAAAGPPVACSGVVLAAQFVFRYLLSNDGGSGQLASAGVSLVLGDVAMPADGSPLVVGTEFSVSWINNTAPVTALQPFSGAPGYLPGFRLLAGVLATAPSGGASAAKAVSRLTGGLQLPGPAAAGRCSGSSGDAVGVTFGYNTSSSCGIGLTRAQLKAFCTANNAAKTLSDLLGGWLTDLTTQQVVLGIWGNADPAHTSQWVTLQSSTWPPGTDLSWDEATATCNNFITGFDINIVTGVAFASGNLQSKVLYAQACFRQGSWSFNAMSGQALQLFPLQFTASFVPKSQPQPAVTLKPAPPLFAPLPPDLFYPFLTSGASGRAPAGIGQSTLIATGLMLLLQLWVLV